LNNHLSLLVEDQDHPVARLPLCFGHDPIAGTLHVGRKELNQPLIRKRHHKYHAVGKVPSSGAKRRPRCRTQARICCRAWCNLAPAVP
jgi:hypothetical protein